MNYEILRKKNTTLAYSKKKTEYLSGFFLMILIFCVRKNNI